MKWNKISQILSLACLLCVWLTSANAYTCEHQGWCDEPTYCYVCKENDVWIPEENLFHKEGTYINLGEKCGAVCDICGHIRETEHWRPCGYPISECMNCGALGVAPDNHVVVCKDLSVCINCESEVLNEDNVIIEHVFDFSKTGFNDHEHYEICVCGNEVGYVEPHFGYCEEPTVCISCDAHGIIIAEENFWHTDSYYINLGDKCKMICYGCGKETEPGNHVRPCDYGYECVMCGAIGVPMDVFHPYGEIYNLGDQHQFECDCGYSEPAEDHYGSCAEPSVCYVCGAEGLEGEGTHIGDYVDMGEYHHVECDICDFTLDEIHWVFCTDQSACACCGSTEFEITWQNRYCTNVTRILSYSRTEHTFYCADCEKTYTEPHDDLTDGSACFCGYTQQQVARVPGDADENNGVDEYDAMAVLQRTASGAVSVNTINADVNSDEVVDIQDALLLLQYTAGWGVNLR